MRMNFVAKSSQCFEFIIVKVESFQSENWRVYSEYQRRASDTSPATA